MAIVSSMTLGIVKTPANKKSSVQAGSATNPLKLQAGLADHALSVRIMRQQISVHTLKVLLNNAKWLS